MTDQPVLSRREGPVAVVTINRPAQLNALNEATRRALLLALVDAANDPEVRCVVLTGAGRAFCVGQDLAAAGELEDCEDCVRRTYNPVAEHLAGLDKPIVAAVNGPAVGAGLGFALGCDIVLMAEGSFLSCSFGKVGLIPDSGTTAFLARAVGHQRAFELASSGRRVGPDEAVALGLANRVVAADQLLAAAMTAADALAGEPARATMLLKRLLRAAAEQPLAHSLAAEALAQGVLGQSVEHRSLRERFTSKARG